MKCPFCKKELILGAKRKFENLSDHVSNPNRESYPLRNTLICDCDISQGCFWDEQGGFYIGKDSDYEKILELSRENGIYGKEAVGSWWEYTRYVENTTDKIFKRLGNYKVSRRIAKFLYLFKREPQFSWTPQKKEG